MCTTKWASVVLIALQQLLTCMKYSYPHTRERVKFHFDSKTAFLFWNISETFEPNDGCVDSVLNIMIGAH